MLKNLLLVGLGGGLGSMLRYGSNLLINTKLFPYTTLTVNILGSFIIGIVFGMSIKEEGLSNNWKLFLATGICGGFTTFSTFGNETMNLLRSGALWLAGVNIIGHMLLSLIAVWIGYSSAHLLWK